MPDNIFIARTNGARFDAQLLGLALALAVGGCATVAKGPAMGSVQDTDVETATPAGGQGTPDDGPTEVVEQRAEDGTLQSTVEGWRDVDGNFVNHGAFTVYWENGQEKTKLGYRNGLRHGDRKSWYVDGKLWKTGRHDQGKPIGTWVEWHTNEAKAREMTFVSGGLNGWMTEWYPDGQMKYKVMYIDGLRQGRETRWDIDGALLNEADYLNDVVQP